MLGLVVPLPYHLLGLDEYCVFFVRLSFHDGGMDILLASVGFRRVLRDALQALQLIPCKMLITMKL